MATNGQRQEEREREAGTRNNGDIIAPPWREGRRGRERMGDKCVACDGDRVGISSMKFGTFEASDWNLVNLRFINEIESN